MRVLDLFLWAQLWKVTLHLFYAALIMLAERTAHLIMFFSSLFLPVGVLDWFRYQWIRSAPRLLKGFRDPNVRPEMSYTTPELCRSRGYPCEEHYVKTSDGFLLGLHRLPTGKPLHPNASVLSLERLLQQHAKPASEADAGGVNEVDGSAEVIRTASSTDLTAESSPLSSDGESCKVQRSSEDSGSSDLPVAERKLGRRPVAFVMHGFLQSSEAFVSTPHNLPFTLADAGYDVWLGNCRGNKYSCKHARLDPESNAYWDFALDEIAHIDIPAVIEYILQVTGAESLSYIGFSQGTAVAFACFSTHPDIARKINLFCAMGPATALRGFSNKVVDALTRSSPHIVYLILGKRRLLPSTVFWQNLLSVNALVKVIDYCVKFLFGWDMRNVHPKDKGLHYSHIYSFCSVKCVVQWFQIMNSGHFQMYDDHRWRARNSKTYIQPHYPVSQIQCPIAIFYGGRDELPDTRRLLDSLPRDVAVHEEPTFEHLDFMYSRSAVKNVYPRIAKLCNAANDLHYTWMNDCRAAAEKAGVTSRDKIFAHPVPLVPRAPLFVPLINRGVLLHEPPGTPDGSVVLEPVAQHGSSSASKVTPTQVAVAALPVVKIASALTTPRSSDGGSFVHVSGLGGTSDRTSPPVDAVNDTVGKATAGVSRRSTAVKSGSGRSSSARPHKGMKDASSPGGQGGLNLESEDTAVMFDSF